MPVQNSVPSLSVPPPVTPVIPAAFVPPSQFIPPQISQQILQAQPVTPQTTSIFEQKMSGAFVVKSDVPNYFTPNTAPVASQLQNTSVVQVPPQNSPVALPKTPDSYREPVT
jgi:hypothetical protein